MKGIDMSYIIYQYLPHLQNIECSKFEAHKICYYLIFCEYDFLVVIFHRIKLFLYSSLTIWIKSKIEEELRFHI